MDVLATVHRGPVSVMVRVAAYQGPVRVVVRATAYQGPVRAVVRATAYLVVASVTDRATVAADGIAAETPPIRPDVVVAPGKRVDRACSSYDVVGLNE